LTYKKKVDKTHPRHNEGKWNLVRTSKLSSMPWSWSVPVFAES